MNSNLKFYRTLLLISSAIVLAILIYLFFTILSQLSEFSIVQNHIVETFFLAIIFFTVEEVSIKEISKLTENFIKLNHTAQVKDKILCCNFTDSMKLIADSFKKTHKVNLNIYINQNGHLRKIVDNFEDTQLEKDINNIAKALRRRLSNSSECICILEQASIEKMEALKNELEPLWEIISTKCKLEEEMENLNRKEHEIEKLNTLIEYTSKISNATVMEEIYMWIQRAVSKIFQEETITLLDTSRGKGFYTFLSSKNVDLREIEEIEKNINSPFFGEHIDAIVNTGRVNFINNTDEYPGWYHTSHSPKSWIGIPLIDLEGRVFMVINIGSDKPDHFNSEDLKFAELLSKNINIAIIKNLLLEQYKMDSITDPLTKLYNRREFEERLSHEITQARRYDVKFSLLLMDLDKFKTLNDTYGHPLGDVLLIEFANVLRNSIRASDLAFRIGGDEFAAILIHADKNKATQIATRIKNNTKKISLGVPFTPSVSIGIKEYNGVDFEALIKECDKYLYLDKLRKEE